MGMNNYGMAVIGLMVFNLLGTLYMHGKPKEPSDWNFYKTFFSLSIQTWLFYMAGMFN